MERKKRKEILVETAIQIRLLLEQLLAHKMQHEGGKGEGFKAVQVEPLVQHRVGRRVIHVRDLVLAEGDWLMTTLEALDVLNFSRGTLLSHREQGLVTEVRIGKEGGGVRFISSEVMRLRELYSVPKGKV
ncbi:MULTISPECIES: hypothetical protein [unclassified Sphingobacterium]|nr:MULTISPECIES: hypothetical protein [unclassified Sphingobacterium]